MMVCFLPIIFIYTLLDDLRKESWFSLVSKSFIMPLRSLLCWRLLYNRICRQGFSMASSCYICKGEIDSTNHLFILCLFDTAVWQFISQIFGVYLDLSSTPFHLLHVTTWIVFS